MYSRCVYFIETSLVQHRGDEHRVFYTASLIGQPCQSLYFLWYWDKPRIGNTKKVRIRCGEYLHPTHSHGMRSPFDIDPFSVQQLEYPCRLQCGATRRVTLRMAQHGHNKPAVVDDHRLDLFAIA